MRNMRKVYLVILLLVVLGAGASYYMIPNEKEVSLILFKEQVNSRYGEVEASYRKRLDAGEVNVNVVAPLVKLYLENGAVDKAIYVMEKFVASNPTNVEIRKQLGTLYQYAQRPDDFLRNLEELNKLQSNRETLKTLSDIYSFNGQHEKQAAVLRELIARNEKLEPQQVLDLANILAADKKNDEAIKTLQSFRLSNPQSTPFEVEELLVSLLMDKGNPEVAFKEAASWRVGREKEKDMNTQVARLVSILHFKGSPKYAQALLDPLGDEVMKNKDLLHEQVLLYLAFGQNDKAYEVLSKLYDENAFPDELIDNYLLLAVQRNDEQRIKQLSDRISTANVDEMQAISLVELSISNKRPALLNIVKERLGTQEYRSAHPLFGVVLALATKESTVDATIESFVTGNKLTEVQQLTIARNCVYAGKTACADRFLQGFIADEHMTSQKLAAAANLYLEMKRYNDGLAFVDKYRVANNSQEVELAWVRLAAANGKDTDVDGWLTKNPDLISSSLLTDMYFVSYENKHYDMAEKAARMLVDRGESEHGKTYLAHALIYKGKFDEALALMEDNGQMSEDDADVYMGALIAMAGKDKAYRKELGDFAAKRLASRSVSEGQKMSLIYALIDAGRLDVAMPHVREYALRRGGKWVYIYAENLDRQGLHDQAREFWLKVAQQPGVSLKEKRAIAFHLLEKGYRNDAQHLFLQFADKGAADGDDVQQLLYLWGPRPTEEQLNWLYNKAQSSKGAVREQWMGYVRDFASTEGIVNLVGKHPEATKDMAIQEQYLVALHKLGQDGYMDTLRTQFAGEGYTTEHLRSFARFARDNNLNDQAIKAFTEIAAREPDNIEAHQVVAQLAFDKADYSVAKTHLQALLKLQPADQVTQSELYGTYYDYAEILRREERDDRAAKYYKMTISSIESVAKPETDMLSKKYQSLMMIGKKKEARDGFAALVEQYPDNAQIRADYIGALIETKDYAKARGLLAKPVSYSEPVKEEAPLYLSSARGYTAFRVIADRREVLLAFNPAHKPKQPLTDAEMKKYPWVNFINEGYDRTLISAVDGYRLEAVRGQDGSLTIVPAKDVDTSVASLPSQLRLRYELMKARVELEDGRPQKAVKSLNALYGDYKDDSQYLGYLANAENFTGRWPRALRLLREAQGMAPENEDILELKRDIERLHAQHIKLDHEWRKLGGNSENITTLSGFATVSEGVDVGVELKNDHVNSTTVQRADGRLGEFKGNRQATEVFVRRTTEDGKMVKGSLFANNKSIGAGVYGSFVNALGTTGASLEYHKPYGDYVESVLDYTNRDRVAVNHSARITSKLNVTAEAGLNKYNVDEKDGVAKTASLEVNVSYDVMDKNQLAIVYAFDGEYELDHKDSVNAAGDLYRMTPVKTREVHALALAGRVDLYRSEDNRKTYLEWLAGYALDRFGGRGPIIEGRLTHEITQDLEAQLRATYGLGQGDTDQDASTVGAYLMYRY